MKFSKLFIFLLLAAGYLLLPRAASAHCPLCVAGAVGGLTLSRLLGIDDSITGVWIGALLGSISFWSERLLIKNYDIRIQLRPIIYTAVFVLTIWSFYQFNLVVKHISIFGVDSLTFGIISGGIVFYVVDIVDDLVIRAHKKVYFSYQRVVIPLFTMVILSFAVYYLINYVV